MKNSSENTEAIQLNDLTQSDDIPTSIGDKITREISLNLYTKKDDKTE